MTEAVQGRDGALVLSNAAVWKRYFDQQSAMRPSEIGPGASRLWEPYRDAAALVMARLLGDMAGGPFARLYASSLADAEREGLS